MGGEWRVADGVDVIGQSRTVAGRGWERDSRESWEGEGRMGSSRYVDVDQVGRVRKPRQRDPGDGCERRSAGRDVET